MIKGIKFGSIDIDCRDAKNLCDFYEKLLGGERFELYGCPALTAGDQTFLFLQDDEFTYQPPVWPEEPDRQQKQIHMDFVVDDLKEAVEEAAKLGATKAPIQYGEEHFVVMFDPDGHPFCLCGK